MYLTRGFLWSDTNTVSAFFLGLLLFSLGFFSLLINESRTIFVDEKNRRITIEIYHRFGSKKIFILFKDIERVGLGRLGDRSDGSEYYDIFAHLKSGKEIYFFGGCAFEGRMDRSRIDQLRESIEQLIFKEN